MKTHTLNLPDEDIAFIREVVGSGAYASADEVVCHGLAKLCVQKRKTSTPKSDVGSGEAQE